MIHRNERLVAAGGVGLLVVILGMCGCAGTIAPSRVGDDHPANPDAQSAAFVPATPGFAVATSARATPAPGPAGHARSPSAPTVPEEQAPGEHAGHHTPATEKSPPPDEPPR